MNTNDFNYGQTVSLLLGSGWECRFSRLADDGNGQIFLLSFLSAELPSGLVSKKLGADVYVSRACMKEPISTNVGGPQLDSVSHRVVVHRGRLAGVHLLQGLVLRH